MRFALPMRWVAVSVFIISSTLNFLDRYLLVTLAPLILAEFHMSQTGFGLLISAFSIAYAASSLFTGSFLDKAGVNRGVLTAVSWWSVAAVSTGFVQNVPGLLACRIALGIGESAGVPAVGKLNAIYLKPSERALGAALNQVGLSIGIALTTLFIGVAYKYSWRTPFVLTGILGFVWMPLWMAVSRTIKPEFDGAALGHEPTKGSLFAILRERQLLLLVIANILWMGVYSLWSTWTTLYLTHVYGLSLPNAGRYIWIPPLVSNLGGFFGGWLSLRWIKRHVNPVAARRKAIWVSALGSLLTFLLPFAPDARWATAVISVSFFFALAGSVNIYALPIDIYGAARSGLAISALTGAFGLLQTVISPIIGYLGDHNLYREVVWLSTIPLLLSALVLMGLRPAPAPVQEGVNS